MKYCIIGKRSSGETLVFTKQGEFSLRTGAARLYDNSKDPQEALKVLTKEWLGLWLSVETVGDGSGLIDQITDNSQIGQDGY